jgi:hypothetical protein
MKQVLIAIFGIGALWDVTTSFLGILGILKVTDFQLFTYAMALVGSVLILGLSLNAKNIWSEYANDANKMLRFVHVIAFVFDFYTSYLGTAQNIILQNSRSAFLTIGLWEVLTNTPFSQQMILLFVTVLVVLSPMIISNLDDS